MELLKATMAYKTLWSFPPWFHLGDEGKSTLPVRTRRNRQRVMVGPFEVEGALVDTVSSCLSSGLQTPPA